MPAGPDFSGPLAYQIKSSNQVLGLVAETLLVAVLLHALLALVLVDLCFTAFLDGAHGCCVRGWFAMKMERSGYDLIQGIFDDPLSSEKLEGRDNVPNDHFVNHCLYCDPTFFCKLRDCRAAERGQLF
jgi:hypothetical protein